MIEFLQSYPELVKWLAVISALMFFGTLALVPYMIIRIPDDYFSHKIRTPAADLTGPHFFIRLLLLLVKNIFGFVLFVMGIAMLILPGQGILTMAVGLVLIDFPRKYQVERWLVSRKRVLKAMNWFRKRANRNPLVIEHITGPPG
jgi:hypothetical protein